MKHILTLTALVFATACFAQIPDYLPTDGLVAWFPFDSSSENVDLDFDVFVGQYSAALDRFGNPKAASFLSENEVLITTQGTTIPSSTFSFSFWAYTELGQEVTTAIHPIHGQTFGNAVSNAGAGVWLGSGYFALIEHSNNYVREAIEIYADFSGWHHYFISYSENAAEVFVDGNLGGQSDAGERTVYAPLGHCSYYQSFGVGYGFGDSVLNTLWSGNRFLGAIDDFAVWNANVSQSTVEDFYYASFDGGCADATACNFNPEASVDDGSCEYGCLNCGPGTVWDESVQLCVIANPSDTNFDGCVSMTDLLDLLSVFGTCNETAWSCGDPLEYQGYDYETVQIGEQCWFAENLRAENYRNGDVIPANLGDSEWHDTSSGAVTVYGEGAGCDGYSPDFDACNPAESLEVFGRLYNWYAVGDQRNLCPNGWHVPADSEWMTMEVALGMSVAEVNNTGWRGTDQGMQMKTAYGWFNGGNGTNAGGFAGLPGGNRGPDGNFGVGGYGGYWWTSSQEGSNPWDRYLGFDKGEVSRGNFHSPDHGFSIRCIQDSE